MGTAGRQAAAVLVIFAISGWLGYWQLSSPKVAPPDAPASEFSARRALEFVEEIARQPHPIGSADHERVRAYILAQLRRFGVASETQESTILGEFRGSLRFARIYNILAKIPGRGGGQTVLIVGHYDSVSTGPGAGDNAAAVAAMLESIRALATDDRLENDLLFLFTDGEEAGLLGIQAFVESYPHLQDIGLALNFEARGTGGPVIMFETSPGNAHLIDAVRRAAPAPVAFSYSSDVYRLMPNDTDFTILRRSGIPGMNFAFIHESARYHSSGDRPAFLEAKTLQHQGSYLLALARHFGRMDLQDLETKHDAVYFNVLRWTVVSYPQGLTVPLSLLLALITGTVIVQGVRSGRLQISGLLAGAGTFLLGALLCFLAGLALRWMIFLALPPPVALLQANIQTYLLGACWIAMGLSLLLHFVAVGRSGGEGVLSNLTALAAGSLLVWTVLAMVLGLWLRASSYLLLWPALGSAAALALWLRSRAAGRISMALAIGVSALSAPAILLWLPTILLVSIALSLPAIPFVTLLVGLVFGLAALPLGLVLRAWGPWPSVVLLVLGTLTTGAGFSLAGFDSTHPRPNSLFYALDAQSGEAFWGSFDDAPDGWTSQFFSDSSEASLASFFGRSEVLGLKAAAPALDLRGSSVELASEEATEYGRLVHITVVPGPGSQSLRAALQSAGGVQAVRIDGERVETPQDPSTEAKAETLRFRFFAPPRVGFSMGVEILGAEPLDLQLIDQSSALPDLQSLGLEKRPRDTTPNPYWLSDGTLIRTSYRF